MGVKRINKKLILVKIGNKFVNYKDQKKDTLKKINFNDQYKFKITNYIGLLNNKSLAKFLQYFISGDGKIYADSYMNMMFNRDVIIYDASELHSWNYKHAYIKIFNIYVLVSNYRVTYLDFITQLSCLATRYCKTTLSEETMDKLVSIQENYLKDDIEPGIAMVGIELFKQIVEEYENKRS